MKINEAYNDLVETLTPVYGEGEGRSIASIVFEDAFQIRNINREGIFQHNETYSSIKRRLLNQEPVQYILGMADFYGLKFKVNPNVLIPRQETEELVLWVKETIQQMPANKTTRLLDIGTGSGCIPITLVQQLPFLQAEGWDISKAALEVAQANAKMNQVNVSFREIDILEIDSSQWPQKFDVVVSNPPYIPHREADLMPPNVLKFEPEVALFVENDDPLIFYRTIAVLGKQLLRDNGWLFFELNEYNYERVEALLTQHRYEDVTLQQDIYGKNRMIRAKITNEA